VKFHKAVQEKKAMKNSFGYLITTARNLCLNAKRNKKNTVEVEDFHVVFQTNFQYEDKELSELVAMALETLDVTERDLFVLRHYEGLSYADIAEITDDNESAVKTRVYRTKMKIRKILAPFVKEIV
jgi:RNA polymerase sigma-70 factor (ECF subfamily)